MDDRALSSPAVSVIVCTRDRGDMLLPTVESILADAPADGTVELVVVDQSSSDSVRRALVAVRDDRLRYHAESSRGLSAARNAGIGATQSELIAFTDDDCVVEPGWISAIVSTFATHSEAGIVFGHVACAEHDSSQGFLPGFEAQEGPLTPRRLRAGTGGWGMGANMALRRSAWAKIGKFDEALGAGATLRSAEDVDYVLRAVACGVGVYHSAACTVVHYGFRPHAEASRLLCGAAVGVGAMYAKHIRHRQPFAGRLWRRDLWTRALDVGGALLRERRPTGINALRHEVIGFARGWALPCTLDGEAGTPIFAISGAATSHKAN